MKKQNLYYLFLLSLFVIFIVIMNSFDDDGYNKASRKTFDTGYAGQIEYILVNNNDVPVKLVNNPNLLYLAEPQSGYTTDIEDFLQFAAKGDSVVKPAGSRCITVYKSSSKDSATFDILGKWVEGWQPVDHTKPPFRILAFYTAKQDPAHISFVHEANDWFADAAEAQHFVYDATDNWNRLHLDSLKNYQIVLFLDTRPEVPAQRLAFEQYMKNGGAWMGFHFAGFALTPSAYPQDWDWYHEEFLGSGSYKSNTWRPTAAVLRIEKDQHPVTRGLDETFISAHNEWYRWENDLRTRPDIDILVSIDSSSFPLGTGPKPHEIWQEGYYPVVWTNRRYRMLYVNMGHNDMDYGGTEQALSSTFKSGMQNRLILNGLRWLGTGK